MEFLYLVGCFEQRSVAVYKQFALNFVPVSVFILEEYPVREGEQNKKFISTVKKMWCHEVFYSRWWSNFYQAALTPTWFFLLFCRPSVWSWWTAGRQSAAANCPTRPEQHNQIQLAQHPRSGYPGAVLQDPPPLCSRCVSSELAAPGCQELEAAAPLVCHWPLPRYWWKWLVGSSWIWGSRQRRDPPAGDGRGKNEDPWAITAITTENTLDWLHYTLFYIFLHELTFY